MIENENDLKELLIQRLSDDFDLISEVFGKNLVDGERVRVDFFAQAREHITALGFTPEWFGIEVKYIKPEKVSSQLNRVFWQAITYGQSVFKIGNPPFLQEIRPHFVFVLVNTKAINDQSDIRYIRAFCQYGNTGQLIMTNLGYTFRFGAGPLMRKFDGKYEISKVINIGKKRYTGNTQGSKARERLNSTNEAK